MPVTALMLEAAPACGGVCGGVYGTTMYLYWWCVDVPGGSVHHSAAHSFLAREGGGGKDTLFLACMGLHMGLILHW